MSLFDWFGRSRSRDSDSLGQLVSLFVLERANKPRVQDIDLWSEATYASLFSVAWEVIFCNSSALQSSDSLKSEIDTLVADTANHAQHWINEFLEEAAKQKFGALPIKFDEGTDMIRYRMTLYFNAALNALDERGCGLSAARSSSCWAILTKCAEELMLHGDLNQHMSPEVAAKYVRHAFEKCDSLAKEVSELLAKHQRNSS